jgi:hypothetical protein
MAVTTVRTSEVMRPPTSLMKIAVMMPAGAPISTAIPTSSSVPMMAC